jgi:cell division transport system permease protein
MRFGFFLREALRNLSRSSAPALAATLTVLITALVLGVFIPIVQATTGTANEVRGRVAVDVYVKQDTAPADRAELRRALESTTNVKRVEYVPKEEGLRRAERKNPDAFAEGRALLGENPLPDLYRVVPDDPGRVEAIVDRLAPRNADGRRAPQLAAIDEVRNREEDTDKILSATSLVKVLTAGLAALLVFASVALIANTIRLSIFARRREVEVMKLVGATNWFIRWPFVIEGVIVGFMGGVLAVLLLAIAKQTFIDPLSDRFALLAAPDTIDFPLLVIFLLIACVAVSAAGSGVTLRRFLRV